MAPTPAPVSDVTKWTYWGLGLLILFGVSYVLYEVLDRQIASVLVFIGGILILYFYYVKLFIAAALNPDWPPYQTVCPDYLTPVSPGYSSSGQAQPNSAIRCVDFVGVSKKGRLKKADPRNIESALKSDEFSFRIDPKESSESLQNRLQTYCLTWVSLFGDK